MKHYNITIKVLRNSQTEAEIIGHELAKQIKGELIQIKDDTTTSKQRIRQANAF